MSLRGPPGNQSQTTVLIWVFVTNIGNNSLHEHHHSNNFKILNPGISFYCAKKTITNIRSSPAEVVFLENWIAVNTEILIRKFQCKLQSIEEMDSSVCQKYFIIRQ